MRLLNCIIVILAILFQAEKAETGIQNCYPNGLVNRFLLSRKIEFIEDRIIPQTDGVPVPKEGINCQWKISNDFLDDPIVVLSGFDTKMFLNSRRVIRSASSPLGSEAMHYTLESQHLNAIQANSTIQWRDVREDTLRALQMPKGSHLTVSFRLTQESSVSRDTPGLRIRLIEPGFCCPEITNYNSGCYTISSVPRSLKNELAAINADSELMSLASFRSYFALQEFVRESQRTRVGSGLSTRVKEPLNLKQNHRVGVFYEHRTRKIFYLSSSAEKCEMAEFEDADRLNYTVRSTNSPVSCGSIKVTKTPEGGEALALVDFVDCNEPLPALISLPDEARKQIKNCASSVISLVDAAHSLRYDAAHSLRKNETSSYHAESGARTSLIVIVPTAIIAAATLLVLVVLSLFILRLKLRGPLKAVEAPLKCDSASSDLLKKKSSSLPILIDDWPSLMTLNAKSQSKSSENTYQLYLNKA